MRNFERILKLGFLVSAVFAFIYGALGLASKSVQIFLVASFLLGVILIFNKKASYNFPQSKRDLAIRRVEGVILILLSPATLLFLLM